MGEWNRQRARSTEIWVPSKSQEGRKWMLIQVQKASSKNAKGQLCGLTKETRSQPLILGKKGRLTPSAQDGPGQCPGAWRLVLRLQGEVAQLCLYSSPWFPTRNWELSAFSENTDAAVAGSSGTVCAGDIAPARSVLVAGGEWHFRLALLFPFPSLRNLLRPVLCCLQHGLKERDQTKCQRIQILFLAFINSP